ncbi:alpha/beta hydrolase family esterase [Amycolatopsis sp. NPDC059657]|uniref:alpha/beta hydrolase family esterase n=1 Tax=Amycolatopsis sp. NPDC059657 TaxID=3346899 RepID=UPI00366CCBF8
MRRTFALLTAVLATLALAPVATAQATPSARTGCGRPAPFTTGASTGTSIQSGGLTREYRVHLPASYSRFRPLPVVLSFHGHKRTSEYQEQLTGMSALNAIVVYPQGLIGTDGESAWEGAPYSAAADDVQFTRDLISSLERQLCVDSRRIYAAGKSNGGGFVGVLACRMPDRIAAFAPVSGAFYPQSGACDPSQRAPIIDFHGTADTTIPYTGNPAKGLPALPDWLAGWASRDRCHGSVSWSDGPVTYQHWLGCPLAHVRIEGLGHVWPSRTPNNDSATPTVIDATPMIWEFFLTHPLR